MIKFRTATEQDVDAIVKLVNSAYRGDYSKQGWTTEADILGGQRTDPESMRLIIQDHNNQIELAIEDNKIIGSFHARWDLPSSLYFGMLTIEPSLQNSGLGKKLLAHVESMARAKKVDRILMSVIHVRSELIAYYERRGYKATGLWEPFPEDDPKYGLPKIKGLKLLEFAKKLSY
jgi:ribosomal protein S18 acetylase RimI-like enzyme